jgi:hypothetical protein
MSSLPARDLVELLARYDADDLALDQEIAQRAPDREGMRGIVWAEKRAGQLRDFSGLRWNTITPTDVDGFLDFGNQLFVFIELKLAGKQLPWGQELALTRLCDATHLERVRDSLAIIAEHSTPTSQVIDVAEAMVTRARYRFAWKTPSEPTTVRQAIDKFKSWKAKQQ